MLNKMSGHTGYSLVFKKQISGREVDPPLSYPLKFFYASLREAAIKQVLLLMTGPLRGRGGVKGRTIKEKRTFLELFFPTFQNFNGH